MLLATSCASSFEAIQLNQDALTLRIQELENANRRLTVRNDALEDKLSLVEDQLHSFVLSQRQRTRLDDLEVVRLVPERDAYEPYNAYDDPMPSAYEEPEGPYEDIVIGDDKLRKYFGDERDAPTRKHVPKPNVVNNGDRLPVVAMPRKKTLPSTPKQPATASATSLYEEGLAFYRKGMFKPAIEKFDAFLGANPPADYVDNALYWLGECHYGLGQYSEAASYFHRIVKEHPDANKVPDALLKVGLTYLRLGKNDSAREVLYYLIEAFPETEAARVARNRLDKVESP